MSPSSRNKRASRVSYELLPQTQEPPCFDPCRSSQHLCIFGLVVSWLAGVACIVSSVILWRNNEWYYEGTWVKTELAQLALNVFITCCNETMGYIHTISLRWALHRDECLTFNSNLRLFIDCKESPPNRWYSNAFAMCGVIITYAASSLTFVTDESLGGDGADPYIYLPALSWLFLGFGLLSQASIASWSLLYAMSAPTWSTSALDTVAASIGDGILEARPGRSLMGVEKHKSAKTLTKPQYTQTCAVFAHREVRYVVLASWIAVCFGIAWSAITGVLERRISKEHCRGSDDCSWDWIPIPSATTVSLRIPLKGDGDGPLWPIDFTWVFPLILCLQAGMTLCLHCLELPINCSRDETIWRKTTSAKGLSNRSPNVLRALVQSWQALVLLLCKPFLHWLFGLSLNVNTDHGVEMRPVQIIYLTTSLVLLAIFATSLTFWKPVGPQPATYGHLQTMADLIDYWPTYSEELMFWGHKRNASGAHRLARAGTSSEPLPSIRMDQFYA